MAAEGKRELASVEPTIVIAAHDRPAELRRCIASVTRSDIEPGTTLVLSLDTGGEHEAGVRAVIDAVDWPHGDVCRIEHASIGLVGHFHACGDLTTDHGPIVFIEDDLVVGRGFHRWAHQALAAASQDRAVAGVGLAAPVFDGYRQLPFEPIHDGHDAFHLQVAWYDGMCWTPEMWRRFRTWSAPADGVAIHRSFDELGDDEWFPHAMAYLVATGQTFLFPHHAQASNSGAAGAHFAESTDWFQTRLALDGPPEWRIPQTSSSVSRYDDHMELAADALRGLRPDLPFDDLTVDLGAVRDPSSITTAQVLTTRPAARHHLSWDAAMHPLVMNVAHDRPGTAIVLADVADVDWSASGDAAAAATLAHHARRGRKPSRRASLRDLLKAR